MGRFQLFIDALTSLDLHTHASEKPPPCGSYRVVCGKGAWSIHRYFLLRNLMQFESSAQAASSRNRYRKKEPLLCRQPAGQQGWHYSPFVWIQPKFIDFLCHIGAPALIFVLYKLYAICIRHIFTKDIAW